MPPTGARVAALLLVAALSARVPEVVRGVPSAVSSSPSSSTRALQEALAEGLAWCGTSGDFLTDQNQMNQALLFVGGVCCDMMHETCTVQSPHIPQTCASAACARAVGLTTAACRNYLTTNSFAKTAYSPLLSPATTVCAHADQAQGPPSLIAT
eukprot:COSAG06_NODE_25051_length_646_cov_2.414991_1_plen_153_part_10